MGQTLDILHVLTNAAPLVLSTIVLAGMLLAFLYAMIKVIIPALQEMNETFQIQRQSWKALIDEQNRINKRLTEELQADLATERQERIKLEKRVLETERELAEKTYQLEAANRQIALLKGELDEVRKDRKKVTEERDKLRLEVDDLHKEVDQLRKRLNELPAAVSGDGKAPTSEPKEAPGEKKS